MNIIHIPFERSLLWDAEDMGCDSIANGLHNVESSPRDCDTEVIDVHLQELEAESFALRGRTGPLQQGCPNCFRNRQRTQITHMSDIASAAGTKSTSISDSQD
jgi:hypothetical protein